MRPIRLRIVATLAVLAFLLPEVSFARVRYFCRMMDRVSASGCCCKHGDSAGVERHAEARRPDCCARVAPPARGVAPSVPDTTIPVPAAALTATIAEPIDVPPRASTVAVTPKLARGPPPVGPPLFVAHCSFLI
jgi:hypothetical protein